MGIHDKLVDRITYKDVQHVMHNGYLFFFKSYDWPFRKSGKKIQVYDTSWQDISVDSVEEFLHRIFKKIEKMFRDYVEINQWLVHDPAGKFPKYSLIIYGTKPMMKIKSLLYKKNTVD
jgi:hypothetical protein